MDAILEMLVRLLCFVFGLVLVVGTLMSAIRTFVLPRGVNTFLTRTVFRFISRIFAVWTKRATSYEERDRVMALFGPLALLSLPVVWLMIIITGYTFMFRAVGVVNWYDSFKTSGSSLFTLGFFFPLDTFMASILAFSEATIGLGIVALLLAYLPTIYAAFSRREALVTMLEIRADSPPWAVTMINRAQGIRGLDYLNELWEDWEVWFSEIDESHTSLAAVNFFRSPQSDRSWITAAGAVLDAASLLNSAVDIPRRPEGQLCIRAGFVAFRHIADFFRIPYHPNPTFPDQPISISREEFEDALDEMAAVGVPIKEDRDQAWQDFAGWRVNYDSLLLALCELTMAPYAPWSSDRGMRRGPVIQRNAPQFQRGRQ